MVPWFAPGLEPSRHVFFGNIFTGFISFFNRCINFPDKPSLTCNIILQSFRHK